MAVQLIETFDPKPKAPVEIRGEFGITATKVPGVFFPEPMKCLAAIMDKLAVVNAFPHPPRSRQSRCRQPLYDDRHHRESR